MKEGHFLNGCLHGRARIIEVHKDKSFKVSLGKLKNNEFVGTIKHSNSKNEINYICYLCSKNKNAEFGYKHNSRTHEKSDQIQHSNM